MPNRSVRASIVFLNNLLYQLAATFVSLVITPLIVVNLGADVFGAWKIIDKASEFLSLGNFKPLGLLRLTLAKDIGNSDFSYKKQQIGAAISILILTLPVMFILSFLFFYFRDMFVPVSKEIRGQTDLTLLVMIVYIVISPFLYMPATIVNALNMQYKLFGVSSLLAIVSAGLQYAVVTRGQTLPWIAAAAYLPVLCSTIISYIIIIRNVPWFKIIRPPNILIKSFFKTNLWVLLAEVFRYIFKLSDLILIGYYFGVTSTAIYSLTKTLVIFLFMPANSLISSILPGIGDLAGRKELKILLKVRSEQINLLIFLGFIILLIVIFFNASFVSLWVNEKHFGGETLSRWIAIAAIIEILAKTEANYIDASLKVKEQTLSLGLASILYVSFIILCQPILGLNVFPIALAISQTILIILYWVELKECLRVNFSNIARIILRPFCIAAILTSSILWIKLPAPHGWMELFAQAFGVTIVAAIFGWFLILQKSDRKGLMTRMAHVLGNSNSKK